MYSEDYLSLVLNSLKEDCSVARVLWHCALFSHTRLPFYQDGRPVSCTRIHLSYVWLLPFTAMYIL